jgi:hypothetical protein
MLDVLVRERAEYRPPVAAHCATARTPSASYVDQIVGDGVEGTRCRGQPCATCDQPARTNVPAAPRTEGTIVSGGAAYLATDAAWRDGA